LKTAKRKINREGENFEIKKAPILCAGALNMIVSYHISNSYVAWVRPQSLWWEVLCKPTR
jgi:hypothetical protein